MPSSLEITDGVARGTPHWAAVTGPDGFIAFQQVSDFLPPEWSGNDVPMLTHLDFLVDDLEAAGTRVLAAGATLLDFQPKAARMQLGCLSRFLRARS